LPAPACGRRKPPILLKSSTYLKTLLFLFVLSLPLVNPWVRGDGVGYYAFARAPLIEHSLDFTNDWRNANTSFRMGRIDPAGHIYGDQYTRTGHLDNHFAIGPAILWSPFLLVAHFAVLAWDRLGGHVAANGFTAPYRFAMALATLFYGFLSLLISFFLARRYVPERWAFWGTLGIWLGSSLPVYMYFNPSWSHALSAFTVALFLWQWIRTRNHRTFFQALMLGLIGGLMLDVYYVSGVLLMLPLMEFIADSVSDGRRREWAQVFRRALANVIFSVALFAAFLPTLIAKKILYGGYFTFGYTEHWYWNSPALFKVCFSAEHGLFSWTPVLLLAVVGLLALKAYEPSLSVQLFVTFCLFVYAMGCYEDWSGISSYGNRFFVSLTPIFVIGLAAFLARLSALLEERPLVAQRAGALAVTLLLLFVLWNFGLIFQWGTHLIPARGPIDFRAAAYNQVAVVPSQAARSATSYLLHRSAMMNQIENEDVRTLKSSEPAEAGTP
jgi:hypothetical protein